jgi:hypothetical protein
VLISLPADGNPCVDLRHEKEIANLLGQAMQMGPWEGVRRTDCGCSCAFLPAETRAICLDCGCFL